MWVEGSVGFFQPFKPASRIAPFAPDLQLAAEFLRDHARSLHGHVETGIRVPTCLGIRMDGDEVQRPALNSGPFLANDEITRKGMIGCHGSGTILSGAHSPHKGTASVQQHAVGPLPSTATEANSVSEKVPRF